MDKEKAPIDSSLEDLLEAGKQAFAAGDRRAAHELWRTAAVANPYDERVWASLLQVLRREDDRQVCLENIISINPLNTDARRQLRGLKRKRRLREEARNTATIDSLPKRPPTGRQMLARAILAGIGIGVVAVLLGVAASAVVYSGFLSIKVP